MSAYITGTAKVTAGSSKVYGSLTEWSTYLKVGDLFKVTSESVFYEIAAINTATQLTLSSRYVNTSFHSAIATNLASVNTATKQYSGILANTPVIQNSVVVVASPNGGGERFTDNGAGALIGNASPAGSGTIDYDSGSWALTLGTPVTATLNMTASYNRGTTGQGLSYQALKDFTPRYVLPEMSANDVNFAHIYTKAVRLIDSALGGGWTYAASVPTKTGEIVTISNTIPTRVTEIEIMIDTVSNNTASQPPIIQLGGSGGLDTSGYGGIGVVVNGTLVREYSNPSGFPLFRAGQWTAGNNLTGTIKLIRWGTESNNWFADSKMSGAAPTALWTYTGASTITASVITAALTTPGGAATFDFGRARLRYR